MKYSKKYQAIATVISYLEDMIDQCNEDIDRCNEKIDESEDDGTIEYYHKEIGNYSSMRQGFEEILKQIIK